MTYLKNGMRKRLFVDEIRGNNRSSRRCCWQVKYSIDSETFEDIMVAMNFSC